MRNSTQSRGEVQNETAVDGLLSMIVDKVADAVVERLGVTLNQPAGHDELVDEPAMAQLAKVSQQTLQRRRKAGDVPSVKIGRRVLYRPADVIDALTQEKGDVT